MNEHHDAALAAASLTMAAATRGDIFHSDRVDMRTGSGTAGSRVCVELLVSHGIDESKWRATRPRNFTSLGHFRAAFPIAKQWE
jgi:hypothetical protein